MLQSHHALPAGTINHLAILVNSPSEMMLLAIDFHEDFINEESIDIPMTEVEAIAEPNGVTYDVRRESVAFVCVHPTILSISASLPSDTDFWQFTWQYHFLY